MSGLGGYYYGCCKCGYIHSSENSGENGVCPKCGGDDFIEEGDLAQYKGQVHTVTGYVHLPGGMELSNGELVDPRDCKFAGREDI